MKKDFDKWNSKKQHIHSGGRKYINFSDREIWFCALGINIGFEQDGSGNEFLRPVIITKKVHGDQFLGVPLTTTPRSESEYFSFTDTHGFNTALLAQIRFFDAKRLAYFSRKIEVEIFKKLEEKLIEFIKSNPRPIHRLDIYEAREHVNPPSDLRQGQKDDPHIHNIPNDDIVK